jgi:fluoride exporter
LAAFPDHGNSRRVHNVSTFSLDFALLYERGQIGMAALYVLLSVALSIGGLFAGFALVRNFA